MKNRQHRQKKAQPLPVLFICISVLPAVILTLMFTIWPTVQALYLSFTNATSLGLNNKFVWLDNYIYMFHDKSFIQALKNTAKLMAVVPVITIFCSLVLAFVLNQCKLKEMVLYRTIFYFPNIVSLTVVGIIWSFVFHPNVGIVNKILGAVGLENFSVPGWATAKPHFGASLSRCCGRLPVTTWSCTSRQWMVSRRKSTSPQRWTVPAHGASSSVLRCL